MISCDVRPNEVIIPRQPTDGCPEHGSIRCGPPDQRGALALFQWPRRPTLNARRRIRTGAERAPSRQAINPLPGPANTSSVQHRPGCLSPTKTNENIHFHASPCLGSDRAKYRHLALPTLLQLSLFCLDLKIHPTTRDILHDAAIADKHLGGVSLPALEPR